MNIATPNGLVCRSAAYSHKENFRAIAVVAVEPVRVVEKPVRFGVAMFINDIRCRFAQLCPRKL